MSYRSEYGHGTTETWKVVYFPRELDAGRKGVALIEAASRSEASCFFQQQYAGQYHTIDTITRVG
jgi:hypothetical protein